ncbi:DUF4198 domain-containing protein [Ottowia testudinis]|uniref:DUF4198 domain-containing protein n=1 Tax=Ottowia testudinis TaxID=2816950 RepID=A0A975CIQ6_9BURK|nr:DUF4198 domain-containing protein [Ottowia testudinis]QTD44143.1 DUF4198 domain-containing protein [Ottowia testudinis]
MKHIFAALALICAATGTEAHHVWLEQDEQGAVLHFGEFGDNLRETSPGLLDKFPGPVARKLGPNGETPVTLKKGAQGFALKARAGKGEALVAEERAYPTSERKEGEATVRSIYLPAARLAGDLSAHKPALTLDLVPTGARQGEAVEFQAFYKSQPLPKAKVEVVTPSGWRQERHTDASGKFSAPLPWRGPYALELSHRDNQPGERAGDRYDRASYVTTLTVYQPTGIAPLPAGPAAQPNK